jgi:hypothetical protein
MRILRLWMWQLADAVQNRMGLLYEVRAEVILLVALEQHHLD